MLESLSPDSSYLPNFSFLGNCDACSTVYIAINFYLLQRSTYKIDSSEQEKPIQVRETYSISFDWNPAYSELRKYAVVLWHVYP